ncbi:unnamed protein product [Didymodactylos carnosus]|uniref:DDE Tnp4 domain-containing protein n=1 Tax=Didymodactylos carnosus TaxID=1234261 RepID=A0A8S2GFJ1_9BILA|nr:unnamed protein product [Didymodactylos carnosus]CAF4559919.1 unnamed protein product [Didymodactylos carnosus]
MLTNILCLVFRQKRFYSGKKKHHCIGTIYICTPDRKFIFYRSGYVGSFHDGKLFLLSRITERCKIPGGTWILGDRGFANRPPVLTPFR